MDNTPLLIIEILSFNNTKLKTLTTNTRMTVVAWGSEKNGNWTHTALFSLGVALQLPIDVASLPEAPASHQAADTHLLVVSPEGFVTLVPRTLKGAKMSWHSFHISTPLLSQIECVFWRYCALLWSSPTHRKEFSVDGCQQDGEKSQHNPVPSSFFYLW